MSPDAIIATDILVYATIAMDVVIVALLLGTVFFRAGILSLFRSWNLCARCLAALVALCALGGSMIYSLVTGFEGCALCLTSRVLMGLLVVVLASPLLVKGKEQAVALWGKVLALLGIAVAGYQYALQWLSLSGTHLPCPAIEGLPSCDRIYFIEFGFITIPFVAISAFALIFLFLFLYESPKNDHTEAA